MAESKTGKKPPRAGLVGPLFGWELIRLARRGQDMRGRSILAFSLLMVLALFTLIWFRRTDPIELFTGTSQSLTIEESASFGQWFSITFVMAQLAVMCLLTPAYAAGGISEEKEKQTLIFLLVSDLTSREILFGKFLGRIVFLLGILFAGLPILSLTQLYGGVSPSYLFLCYLITTTTTIMLAAISATAAVYAETYRGALFRAYSITALFVFVGFCLPYFSPFAVLPFLFHLQQEGSDIAFWVVGVGYAGGEFLIAASAVILGTFKTQRMRATPMPYVETEIDVKRKARRLERRREPIPLAKKSSTATATLEIMDDDASRPAGVPLFLPTAKRILLQPDAIAETFEVNEPPKKAVEAEQPRFRRRLRPPPVRRPASSIFKPRPRVNERDPFLWKERFVTGRKNNGDDESIRSVLTAIGIAVGVVVGFFGLLILFAVLVTGFNKGSLAVMSNFLLTVGIGSFTVYLLMIGTGATGSVVQERQRMTLESLLLIPVDRSEILRPKWRVSMLRAWWWGAATGILIPLGFLSSTMPLFTVVMIAVVVLAPPAIVSYGLWLSIRCGTSTKAILWLMPGIVAAMAIPFMTWVFADPESLGYWFALISVGVGLIGAAGVCFFFGAEREFERIGRR